MHVWLDYTNEQISMTIKAQIIAAYQQMGQVIEQRGKSEWCSVKINILYLKFVQQDCRKHGNDD